MSGIYYALSIVAVFVVIRWFIANDKIGPDEPTTGLLAMRGTGTANETSRKTSQQSDPRANAPSDRRDR
jgi:hypothetical protein